MPKEIEEPEIDTNPEIKTYIAKDNVLTIEKTHGQPVVKTESHKVEELQAKIAKFDRVIAIWEAKKKPYQDLINKYNEHKSVEMSAGGGTI